MKFNDTKILITGKGYIGNYLKIYLNIHESNNVIILKRKDYMNSFNLKKKIKNVDIIFHNASSVKKTKSVIEENAIITNKLITSIDVKSLKVFIHFGSTHENLNNYYGISKKECFEKFKIFLKKNKISLLKYTIPNIYGCFYKPYHNSFLSTLIFEYVKNNNVNSIVDIDLNKNLELVYINDLISNIFNDLKLFEFDQKKPTLSIKKISGNNITIGRFLSKVKLLTNKINKNIYNSSSILEKNILNIILSYQYSLKKNYFLPHIYKDRRGHLYEISKSRGINHSFLSNSFKNIKRGDHFHTNKFEIFHILKGEAEIHTKNLIDNTVRKYTLNDNKKSILMIPPFVNHTFISKKNNTLALFFSSEIFDILNPDTYNYVK